ncbi:MAG: DUF1343 domain-containing protein [Chlamydiae bacterium]|nr:DUF1343 domain-containing protein [Chlamydiota bacterium]
MLFQLKLLDLSMRVLVFFLSIFLNSYAVELGVDQFFSHAESKKWKEKNIGLIVNQTSMNHNLESTVLLFIKNGYKVKAIFTPEHGLFGSSEAGEKVESTTFQSIPVYSLYGQTRRPTMKMLEDIDILIFDIQDIGVRSYTYASTLYYAMEEIAKIKKKLVVLDRPNPLGGQVVDGMMLEPEFRSFVGYVNVPYCHGMTIGELALYFNAEYQIQADLEIIPMKGWKRAMSFRETKLPWVPSSPNIPEPDTPFYYATTGLLGELGITSIGIGFTLPFKVVAAPWIDADSFAMHLNSQHLPGVKFIPTHYKPFSGQFKGQVCHGILIKILDEKLYKPATTQMMLLGMLKSLYPKFFNEAFNKVSKNSKELFCKCSGSMQIFNILEKEKYASWKLIGFHAQERETFIQKRKKYLLPQYENY